MKSSIKLVLLAGAFAIGGAASVATADTEVTVTTSDQPVVNYKSEYAQCSTLPGSDQAQCHDAVGMRNAEIDRAGVPNEELGSLQSGDRCEYLSPDARRDCQLSDKAG